MVGTMSIEALAMAGVDYKECGINLELWEQGPEPPPPYLLAEKNSSIGAKKRKANASVPDRVILKEALRHWAKAVAVLNEPATHSTSTVLKTSEHVMKMKLFFFFGFGFGK